MQRSIVVNADFRWPLGSSQRICACGLLESEAAWEAGGRACPVCRAVWPERLYSPHHPKLSGVPLSEWIDEASPARRSETKKGNIVVDPEVPSEFGRLFERVVTDASLHTDVDCAELRRMADGSWEAHAHVGPEDGEDGVVGRHRDLPWVAVRQFAGALRKRLDALGVHGPGFEPALARLRQAGWQVAIHNDYRLDGESCTFWLFTHPSGVWAKGEGASDEEALIEVERQAAERLGCGVAVPVEAPGRARRFFPLPGRGIPIWLALPYVVEQLHLPTTQSWAVRAVLREFSITTTVTCGADDLVETWLEHPGFITFKLSSVGAT